MKFLCDQMCSRIGKWLRIAGYDTSIVTTPIPDRDVLRLALADKRLLVTRDRHFLLMKEAKPILIYLKNNDFEKCIDELNRQVPIDWFLAPFSRCLVCNCLLEKPGSKEIELIPERILMEKLEFWYCPDCQHIYWEGSHTERMRNQLQFLQKETAF